MLDVDGTLEQAIFCIMSITGPEFSQDEFNLPFETGGWLSSFKDNLNTVFEIIDEGKVHPQFLEVSLVKKQDVLKKPKVRTKYRPVDIFVKEKLSKSEDPFKERFLSTLKKKFKTNSFSKKNDNSHEAWEHYKFLRLQSFKRNSNLTIYFVLGELMKEPLTNKYWIPRRYFTVTDKVLELYESIKIDDIRIYSSKSVEQKMDLVRAQFYEEDLTNYNENMLVPSLLNKYHWSNGRKIIPYEIFLLMICKNMSYDTAKKNCSRFGSIFICKFIFQKDEIEKYQDFLNEHYITPDKDLVYRCPITLKWYGGMFARIPHESRMDKLSEYLDFVGNGRNNNKLLFDKLDQEGLIFKALDWKKDIPVEIKNDFQYVPKEQNVIRTENNHACSMKMSDSSIAFIEMIEEIESKFGQKVALDLMNSVCESKNGPGSLVNTKYSEYYNRAVRKFELYHEEGDCFIYEPEFLFDIIDRNEHLEDDFKTFWYATKTQCEYVEYILYYKDQGFENFENFISERQDRFDEYLLFKEQEEKADELFYKINDDIEMVSDLDDDDIEENIRKDTEIELEEDSESEGDELVVNDEYDIYAQYANLDTG